MTSARWLTNENASVPASASHTIASSPWTRSRKRCSEAIRAACRRSSSLRSCTISRRRPVSASAMRMAVRVIRTGRLSCRCLRCRSNRTSRWATPVASTSWARGSRPSRAHDQGQLAAEDIVPVQVKRVEEGGIDGEHAQVGAEEQEAGGHARDDRLRIPPEVEDRALLLHLRVQEGGALLLAPEADQQAGECQEKEGRRHARELPRAPELGEGLFTVDLEQRGPRRSARPGGWRQRPVPRDSR